jgi:methionine-rich copper-binding protein CopC
MPTRTQMHKPRGGIRNRMLAVAAATFVACALALVPATGASAHDYLVDSTPKADSIQTTPLKQVTLTFDDVVLDLSHNGSSALLQVTGPDGSGSNSGERHFETGCPTIEGRTVSAPVALGADGNYTITWQIVSADGHTVSNSITFTYQPPAGTAAANGTSSRPECGRGAATDQASQPAAGQAPARQVPATGSQAATSDSGALGIVITIACIIVGLAIVGVVIVVLTARRRQKDDEERPKRPGAPEDD